MPKVKPNMNQLPKPRCNDPFSKNLTKKHVFLKGSNHIHLNIKSTFRNEFHKLLSPLSSSHIIEDQISNDSFEEIIDSIEALENMPGGFHTETNKILMTRKIGPRFCAECYEFNLCFDKMLRDLDHITEDENLVNDDTENIINVTMLCDGNAECLANLEKLVLSTKTRKIKLKQRVLKMFQKDGAGHTLFSKLCSDPILKNISISGLYKWRIGI